MHYCCLWYCHWCYCRINVSASPSSVPPGEFWDVQEAKNDSDGFCHTFGFELINYISSSDVCWMHVAASSCVVHFQFQNWTNEEEGTLLPSSAPRTQTYRSGHGAAAQKSHKTKFWMNLSAAYCKSVITGLWIRRVAALGLWWCTP